MNKKNSIHKIILTILVAIFFIMIFIGIRFGKEITEWGKELERNAEIKQENRRIELENRIVNINSSKEAPNFDSVYYYKRVGNHKDVQNLKEQFIEDFKENFRNYEKRR